MFKRLLNWLFAKEDEQDKEVKVFDFTTSVEGEDGMDITMRFLDGGEHAEGVVFQNLGADHVPVGAFIVVDVAGEVTTYIVDTAEAIALGVTQITCYRMEGVADA